MDTQYRKFLALLVFILSLMATEYVVAAPVVFTHSAAFNTAISSYTKSTLNFDNSIAGNLIADGGTLGSITFNYPSLASQGVSMQIRDDYSAISGANYLGTDSGGAFLGGDAFSLSFASANAIGLFFLSGDALLSGDIGLTLGSTVATLSSAYDSTLSDGSYVYFLGLVDADNSFNSVTVTSLSGGNFEYNVDDITTATNQSNPVPEPSILALLLVCLIPMYATAKSKHKGIPRAQDFSQQF